MSSEPVSASFFANAAEFRAWLEQNHDSASELRVGFYKKASGLVGLTYAEAVDEALCFGWIDGVLRRIDEQRYCLRFTPRKLGSNWSLVNVEKVARLTKAGRMRPAGLAAFERRDSKKVGVYSFERKEPPKLSPADEKRFRANRKAWEFFNAQAPSYRRLAIHKIISPKQQQTRERWLTKVIAASAARRRALL